jgi:dienelactone hydrolase
MQGHSHTDQVIIETENAQLAGMLTIPKQVMGIVLFAHGSGSSRFSPRNQFVAERLNEGGLATLLFDLLTAQENLIDEQTRALRFDIELLSQRLIGAIDWVGSQHQTQALPIGLFGASTGSAAALNAAAQRQSAVEAVVSRGGRPDLASELSRVTAPTLLIVGGLDSEVIKMNEAAAAQLAAEHCIKIIPGASHLFEESGTLEAVATIARDWFRRYLA